ncbi:MAG: hypothetical protein ABIR58_00270, partial [Gemmatimonadaceae bacterium]
LEDVSVVLENGLIEGRFWLPRRQEIEIRRTGTWMDFPARGIIRGRWEICCYEVNKSLPPGIFNGPEIVLAPRGTRSPFPFKGEILDSLPPDVRAVTDEEVAKVQEEARALVRAQALARSRTLSLSARRASDIVRVNRVEGLAVGGGIARRLGDGLEVSARGRYGLADERAKGRGEIAYRRANGAGFSLAGYDDHRDASDAMETSQVRNSIASQEFGSDYSDPFGVRGFSLTARTASARGWSASLEGASENHRPLAVNARPASGRYEPTIDAWDMRDRRLTLSVDRATRLLGPGIEARLHGEASGISYRRNFIELGAIDPLIAAGDAFMSRFSFTGNFERPFGRHRLVAHSVLAIAAGDPRLPPQHLVYLGGPTTGPGYEFHEFVGRGGLSQRLEFRTPAPFPSFKLGRYGRTPAEISVAPYVHLLGSRDPLTRGFDRLDAQLRETPGGWYPSVGVGLLSVFDLIRLDVARGLRDGRWMFSVDVGRDFWGIL